MRPSFATRAQRSERSWLPVLSQGRPFADELDRGLEGVARHAEPRLIRSLEFDLASHLAARVGVGPPGIEHRVPLLVADDLAAHADRRGLAGREAAIEDPGGAALDGRRVAGAD